MVAAQCSASSGFVAMTTRFITLVRAETCRACSPSITVVMSWPAHMRASWLSISGRLWARVEKRRMGSPSGAGVSTAMVSSPPYGRRQRRPSRARSSSASAGPHVPAS